jgi:hypothetical protein
MKTRRKPARRQLQLKLLSYGEHYYIDRCLALEKLLAQRPRQLRIELIGDGEIPADLALLLRSILMERKPGTKVITHARSSLQNGSVLVWLLGDQRIIRDDARLFFRKADLPDNDGSEVWKEKGLFDKFSSGTDPEEHDHAKVLEFINEFLPVKELAGKIVGLPVLRQFGLVDNETLDRFLATALGQSPASPVATTKQPHDQAKVPQK